MHTFDKKIFRVQITFCSDANLVLITSDCCHGTPANDFLVCFDFWLGSPFGSEVRQKSKQSRESSVKARPNPAKSAEEKKIFFKVLTL